MSAKRLLSGLLATACLLTAADLAAQQRIRKKIVEYGWDVPYPEFVRDNIRQMEKRPFDGIIFRTKGFDHAFDTRPWKQTDLKPQLDTLSQIRWGRFTDNFLTLYSASKWNMDWFDDEQWITIVENMKLFSLAVRSGRCIGVCFDPEPYGTDPWVYPGAHKDKSFDEVAEQVRRRGSQLVTALQEHVPQLKILSFFQFGLFGDILDEPDPGIRRKKLLKKWMVLLPAFYVGILEGAAPGTILIDGNESAYYYESHHDYFHAYHLIRQRAQSLVPESLRKKYNAQVQAGMALYIDQTLAKRTTQTTSHFMSPEQQLKFFEHNVYYALTTSDEYVWCYSERMNWWLPPEKVQKDRVLPPGVEEALVSAKQKYERGKPLGYGIDDIVRAAREKRTNKK
ncbi:MAG: hypothetical protein JSU94_19100 [Phycisphaerales bacterium]|nr:MAG: hypothetical protein JSU94_19100 [Phycisphaerales bacterium]